MTEGIVVPHIPASKPFCGWRCQLIESYPTNTCRGFRIHVVQPLCNRTRSPLTRDPWTKYKVSRFLLFIIEQYLCRKLSQRSQFSVKCIMYHKNSCLCAFLYERTMKDWILDFQVKSIKIGVCQAFVVQYKRVLYWKTRSFSVTSAGFLSCI